MANITNDAWFGETSGPWQHLGMLPLRAVEHRVAIARAANTGVSAFVAPSGAIGPMLPLLERGVLHAASRSAVARRSTPASATGFAYACAAVDGGRARSALFRRSSRVMLGELKRDVSKHERGWRSPGASLTSPANAHG